MTYKDFNEKVFHFYLSRANSAFFTFSIDHSEFISIVSEGKIPIFKRLEANWSLLLREKDGIPQYFGLIALQCYAGSRMENDEAISERVYNGRLLQVLQLEGVDVQELYKDGNSDDPAQEQIWFAAKEYMLNNYGLRLDIPERRSFSRRYVQFPISQVLLNAEHLKQFTLFFVEHFIVNEDIPYQLFRERLIKWISGKGNTRGIRIIDEADKKEKCLEQVFNYYQNWNGNVYKEEDLGKRVKERSYHHTILKSRILLSITDGIPKFILDNKILEVEKLLELKYYFYFHKGILLFNPLLDYDDDYEDSRLLLRLDNEYYILLDRTYDQMLFAYLEGSHLSMTYFSLGIWLFRFKVDSNIPFFLNKYFYEVNPVQLHFGIKLNRSNIFLKGFGPSIHYDKFFRIIYNSLPITYDPENAEVGKYIVRTEDYKDVIFNIENSPEEVFIISENKGWDLFTFSISSKPIMEGCLIKSTLSNTIHPIRQWIKDLTLSSCTVKNQQQNLRLRVLNNGRIQELKNKRRP